jgi:regulator of protease activity HflC (stomatin/prohibitin superfamily)
VLALGCAGTIVQPGHRALLFDPMKGGVQHEVLQPGYYSTACGLFARACPRIDDFDVTYTRQLEHIQTNSKEGLALDLKLTLVYRPIIAELYLLDTEIGPNFYEEVVGPEFRSAARGVFARNSYLDLQARNEKLEDEIEAELRRRVEGKHVAVESVLLESVSYAPEIVNAVRAKLVGEQDSARQKALMETEGSRKKREIELAAEEKRLASENEMARKKLEIEYAAEEKRLATDAESARRTLEIETEARLTRLKSEQQKATAEAELRAKKAERELALEQAALDRVRASAEADVRLARAKALAEENRAEGLSRTPIDAMIHAYDALGKLGGDHTSILIGDWSKVPTLIPPNFQSPLLLSPYPAPRPTKSE